MCRPSLLLSLERQSDIPRGYRQLEFPRGSTGVSRSWNCHPPKIAPHPWNFLTPCFAISKIFPPLRRSRTEEMPFPPEKLNERSTMGKVFSLSLEPFVLEHVRFVFLEESLSSGPCCLSASLLETGYEYSFCRVLFRGERCSRFLHNDFQWIFRLPISG